jgi:hypothetical protein
VVIDGLLSLNLAAILKTCVSVSAPLQLSNEYAMFDSFIIHQYIGAANNFHKCNGAADKKIREILKFRILVFLCLFVQRTKFYEYIGATMSLVPINWCFASCASSIGKNASTLNRMVQQC